MKILNKKIASKKSSAAWIQRQAADPYVARAHRDGYRARAAYKLIEMNERYNFLKNGQVVVDLGAAPGSWSQYVMRAFPKSRVFAMDLLEITPIPGVEFYQGDFTTDDALDWLVHIRQMVLLEYAFDFACRALKPGGVFVAKSFTGGTTGDLLKQIKERFETVHHIKPPASRKDSVEMFIVALGFKG